MIKSFGCKETERIWEGEFSCKLPSDIQQVARRKLRMLNNACDLHVLHGLPGNHLEKLEGERKGEWSMRVNDQWRICFHWDHKCALDVKMEDYH